MRGNQNPNFPFLGLRCTNFNSKNGRQSALHADYIATFRIKIGAHPNNPKTVFTLLRQSVVAHPWHPSAAPAPPHLPWCPSRKHIYICVTLFDSINTIEEENLIACDKADRFIYEWILNKDNLSYTNDSIKNVENYYRIALLMVNLTSMNIDELDKSTRLYVHILEDQKELNECFNPIFDFI